MSNPMSNIDLNAQIVLVKTPDANYPKINDIFQLKIVPPIPTDAVPQGSLIVKNLFLSVDATMRIWISGLKTYTDPVFPGDCMKGSAIG